MHTSKYIHTVCIMSITQFSSSAHIRMPCLLSSPDPNFMPGARRFHPGLFSGRLNRVNDVDTSGLEYFWSCCGQPDKEHPGCATGRHASYDDPEEGGIRSPLTGSKLR